VPCANSFGIPGSRARHAKTIVNVVTSCEAGRWRRDRRGKATNSTHVFGTTNSSNCPWSSKKSKIVRRSRKRKYPHCSSPSRDATQLWSLWWRETGLRSGEALAVRTEDFDPDCHVLHVRRSVWHRREQAPKLRTRFDSSISRRYWDRFYADTQKEWMATSSTTRAGRVL